MRRVLQINKKEAPVHSAVEMPVQVQEQLKQITDAVSIGTIVATIVGWLPSIAAFISIIWGLIRIWETRTLQNLVARRRKGKAANVKE